MACGIVLLLGVRCSFSPNKLDAPKWTTELLGPLVKTSLSPDDIIQLQDVQFSQSIKMSNLGTPNGTYPFIPAIPPVTQGPFAVQTSQSYASVTFASGKMGMVITNNLPINLKSGSTFVIEQGSSTFFSHTINVNINPGEVYTMTPEYDLAGKTLNENISVKVQNFASDGKNSPTTINGSEELKIEFSIKGLKIQELGIASNNRFAASDTNNFSIQGGTVKTGSVSGKLVLFADNQMPIAISLQGYFLGENKLVVDSLFSTRAIINAAGVDGTGHSNTTTSSVIDIPITTERFEKIKEAKYLRTYAEVATTSGAPLVFLRTSDKLMLQLVGDLKITIDKAQ